MFFLDILYFTRNLPGFDNCEKIFSVQFCKFWRDDKLATGEGYHNISLSSEDYVIQLARVRMRLSFSSISKPRLHQFKLIS